MIICLGPFALYWLQSKTPEFKAKYIRSMVNIAAPWGGAIKALRLMTSGDNIDVIPSFSLIFLIDHSIFRSMLFHRFVFDPTNVLHHQRHS